MVHLLLVSIQVAKSAITSPPRRQCLAFDLLDFNLDKVHLFFSLAALLNAGVEMTYSVCPFIGSPCPSRLRELQTSIAP